MSTKSASRPTSQVFRDDPLCFEVIPDFGLRNEHVQFDLGSPLNQVLVMLQQNARLFPNIRLAYSKKNPFTRDICINLANDGIKLFFDSFSQLLKHIDVDNFSSIILKYNDKVFSEPGAEASLDRVDEYFASTHPGAYDEKQKLYVQRWPGLAFCFPNSGNVQVAPGFGPHLRSLQYDGSSQPKLTKMMIFKANEEKVAIEMPLSCYCGQNRTSLVSATFNDGVLDGVDITFTTQGESGNKGADDGYELTELRRTIRFGDDVGVVMTALGAPSKVFYKSEDKMSIHRGGNKETLGNVPHFFFNYFSMGLDVLFDFNTKRVIKFVLHSNLPGHYDFGIYARCFFEIALLKPDQSVCITNGSKYVDVNFVFENLAADQMPKPVVSRRRDQGDPFGSTYLYGINQLIIEVLENQHIATVTLFDASL